MLNYNSLALLRLSKSKLFLLRKKKPSSRDERKLRVTGLRLLLYKSERYGRRRNGQQQLLQGGS